MDSTQGDILTCEDLSYNKGLTVCYWNIRSFYPKFDEFCHCVNSSECEIFFAGESWMTHFIDNDLIHLNGYNIFRNDRDKNSNKKRGAGLLAYARDKLQVNEKSDYSICTPHIETLVLQLHLPSVKEIYYIGVYRPPDGNVHAFFQELEVIMYSLTTKPNYEINIIVDTNLTLSKSRDPVIKRYKDFLKRNHLTNIILYDTHFNHEDRGSCIDHFITSDPVLYQQCGICPTDISDHYIIFASRKKFKTKND